MMKKQEKRLKEYAFDSVEAVLNFSKMDVWRKIEITKQGITKRQLLQFKEVADLEYYLISQLMAITDRTIYIKKSSDVFRLLMSDTLVSLIELYSFGYSHFNDPAFFNRWMKTGSPEQKYEPPVNRCHTFVGREETKREILRFITENPALGKELNTTVQNRTSENSIPYLLPERANVE